MSFFDFLRPTLKVAPMSLTLKPGSSAKLTINRRATFSSVAPSVASVDSGGQIVAVGPGKTGIVVTDSENYQQVIVGVTVEGVIPVPPPPSTPPIQTLTLEERVARIERRLGL